MFTHELTGEVPNYATIYSKLVQATDFHVGFSHEMPSSETKGVTRPRKKEIQLRSGMSERANH